MLDGRSEHLPVNELAGGARIRHIFLDIFVQGLQELNPSRCCTSSCMIQIGGA
jgi:dynamin 1-like protein